MIKLYDALNKQVANMAVLFTKLHHYHWYVEGTLFFTLHEKFEELYDEVNGRYDEIAERLITIGGTPSANMKDYLRLSSLSEATGKLTALEMVTNLNKDLVLLVLEFREVIVVAEELCDASTADIFIEMVSDFQKHLWMLGAVIK